MKFRSRSLLGILAVFLTILFLVPAVLPAQSCDEVRFRLWQKDAETAWFAHGEPVEIGAGESGHVYVHVSGAAEGRSSHYATRATIGYPQDLHQEQAAVQKHGERERTPRHRAGQIAQHLKVDSQDASDRAAGRIQLEAKAPGDTALSYRIEGVKSPGRLEMVPPPCRKGLILVRVTGTTAPPADKPADEPGEKPESIQADRHAAAEELTEELMSAFLRREVTDAEGSFVDQILRYGRDGILYVAGQVASSREFRTATLERTDEAHDEDRREKSHEVGLDELRAHLLEDVYRDLYGYVEPSDDEHEADLRDLEICLEGQEDACERLGREIVSRRAFYEHHRELLEQLAKGVVRR